jgi:gluconokinase
MKKASEIRSIVVMGVSGSGKSTIALAVASRVGAEFIDADWLHSPENVAKMSTGHALSDEDRWPWLNSVGQRIKDEESKHRSSVVACSALKRTYRDVLRQYVPNVFTVFLDAPAAVLQARVGDRKVGFMAPSLLASQLAILQPLQNDELGMRVDIEASPDEIVNQIVAELRTTRPL